MALSLVPLLGFIVLVYNALAFLLATDFEARFLVFRLPSGGELSISTGALLIMAGVIASYIETLKATRTGRRAMIDHGLSMVVFVICLVEFLLIPAMGTATFLILTLMALIDVVGGFTVSLATARRDIAIGHGSDT
jgi:hypothetical protein